MKNVPSTMMGIGSLFGLPVAFAISICALMLIMNAAEASGPVGAGMLPALACGAQGEEEVFGPTSAGQWYPDKASALRKMVQGFFAATGEKRAEGKLLGLIAPHAGYRFSGEGAAYAYAYVKSAKPERVIILAPSHQSGFKGCSILKAHLYDTPLGSIPVDVKACDTLLAHPLIDTHRRAHMHEHSLETQLPFLQVALGKFQLVPILVGRLTTAESEALAALIRPLVDEKTLLVASSDFTHYGRNFGYLPFPTDGKVRENLEKLDRGALEKISAIDAAGFERYLQKTSATICGRKPISLLLRILPEGARGEVVKYYTSGDAGGDYHHSVSYASVIFTAGGQPEQKEK